MTIKISEQLNRVIAFAREEAMRTGSYGIAPDHLMLALVRHGSNKACEALKSLGVDLQEMKQFVDARIFTNEHIPYDDLDKIDFSRGAHNVLSFTVLEATRLNSEVACVQHLLLALTKASGSYAQAYLHDVGIDYGRLLGFMHREGMLAPVSAAESEGGAQESESSSEDGQAVRGEGKTQESALDSYGYDLSKAAADGRLDPVIGRDDEIGRVIQILGRRKKNNPMLLGEPGVGKSAIVEGIALRIASGNVPAVLKDKKIISLDIASVVAGTRYRGDFEKRLKAIINELQDRDDIVLFIDEFHTMVGAGGSEGGLDAAGMLKPALARGGIQCIGATTLDEFTKIVEKDGALDRRFQKVIVEPADVDFTIKILRQLQSEYEAHHSVKYTDEALCECARMSDRYITDRCLPDKAIDVMDEAGSMVRLRKGKSVGADEIAAVISLMTGIPAGKVARKEGARLLGMKESLQKIIIGQDEAIDTIVRAIHRSRAGIQSPRRPIGTFLFLGPTGVGKTRLAKAIAEELFDSEENLIRIDMSEYMEKFTVSRLVGAPPGYVGFDEGGQLSEQVRRKPYSVVLLDEIEKAHPDIFNLLLQILDEGRLTDSNGRSINFRNTIIIMTSNVGSREIEEYGSGLGFAAAGKNVQAGKKGVLTKAVRKIFPPEFINRIDDQIYFNSLDKDNLSKIIEIEIKDLRERIAKVGFKLSVSAAAKAFVAEAGYDPAFGARPLTRAIRKYIEDPVSEFIIADRMAGGVSGYDGEEKKSLRTIKIGLSKTNPSELEVHV